VLAASELAGVKVATVLPALKLTEPATGLLLGSVSVNDTVFGNTAWEKVAVGATESGLPVEPPLGVTVVTDGGALGVTVLECADSGPEPAELDAMTVKV
jgi:hypothetical protein